jgi:hypothetical protein
MTSYLKSIFTTILIGLVLTSCGPSAREMEKNRIDDSTKVAESLAKQNLISKNLSLSTRAPNDKKFIKTAETKFLVRNVRMASDKIEDLAAKYSGYVTYSNLGNHESDYSKIEVSRDSILISRKIVVENQMVLRIPNENLDSLVRELNKLIVFLDYRIIKMDDISFAILANSKASDRLQKYEIRQQKHIDKKESKLKEVVSAEDNVLSRQIQADNLQIENLTLADQAKYCTLSIFLYQKPIYYSETQVQPNTESFRPNLFKRIVSAVIDGWIICEYFIVFIFQIWWLFIIAIVIILGYNIWFKPSNRKKAPPF